MWRNLQIQEVLTSTPLEYSPPHGGESQDQEQGQGSVYDEVDTNRQDHRLVCEGQTLSVVPENQADHDAEYETVGVA